MAEIPYVFRPIPDEFLIPEYLDDPIMMRFIAYILKKISTQPQILIINGKRIELEPFEFVFGRDACAKQAGITTKQARNRLSLHVERQTLTEIINKRASTFSVYRLSTDRFSKNKGQHSQHDDKYDDKKGQHLGQQKGQHFSVKKGQHLGQQKGQHFSVKKGQHSEYIQTSENKYTYEDGQDTYLSEKGQHFSVKKGQQKGQQKGHKQDIRVKKKEVVLFVNAHARKGDQKMNESIDYFSMKGEPRHVSSDDIFKHFTDFTFSTETLREAISRAQANPPKVHCILGYIEGICKNIERENLKEEPTNKTSRKGSEKKFEESRPWGPNVKIKTLQQVIEEERHKDKDNTCQTIN